MTQEEKSILLKDLCGRYPYSVKVNVNGEIQTFDSLCDDDGYRFQFLQSDGITEGVNIENIKPYLRPMSSMMQGEWESMTALIYPHGRVNCNPDNKNELLLWLSMDGNDMPISLMEDVFTWLNRHQFDYRGLIPKGLALEAPEDMYKI